jgi:hypothetical protein
VNPPVHSATKKPEKKLAGFKLGLSGAVGRSAKDPQQQTEFKLILPCNRLTVPPTGCKAAI